METHIPDRPTHTRIMYIIAAHTYTRMCIPTRPLNTCLSYCVQSTRVCTERIKQTVSIDATTVDIEEKGVKLRLTVVDTPGFGDAVDNRQW